MTPAAKKFFDFGRALARQPGEQSGRRIVQPSTPAFSFSRSDEQYTKHQAGVKAGGGLAARSYSISGRDPFSVARAGRVAPFGGGDKSPITHCIKSSNSANPSPDRPVRAADMLAGIGREPDFQRDPAAHREFAQRVLAAVGVALREEGAL